MLKRTAAYILILISTLYLFFMYDETVIPGILVLELLYPLASAVYLHYLSGKVNCCFGYVSAAGEKNCPVKMKIKVENKSALGQIRLLLTVSVRNNSAAKKKVKKLAATAGPKCEDKLGFEVLPVYSGNLEVCVEAVKIYDFLGMFYRQVKIADRRQIGIMPPFHLMPLEVTRRTREFIADADEYSMEKSGDDPADIYQVRAYRDKDSIHDIHWKLSAKEDELMVKEHALPLGCKVLVFIEFSDKDSTGKTYDRLMERTAALSFTLIEEKCIHMAAWFEEKSQRIVRRKIDSEEAVYALIWRLLLMEPYSSKDLMQVFYEEAFRGQQFSSIITVREDGKFFINGQRQEFLQI